MPDTSLPKPLCFEEVISSEASSISWPNLDERAASSLCYTSGTTGKPKGVPLTHSNLLHQIRSLACIANPSPGSPVLSVLPIWHSYERSAEYYFFSCASIKALKRFSSEISSSGLSSAASDPYKNSHLIFFRFINLNL